MTPGDDSDKRSAMAEWRDIPAQRVLIVEYLELRSEYERLDENGEVVTEPNRLFELLRRKRDGKLFRLSLWQPGERDVRSIAALSEV